MMRPVGERHGGDGGRALPEGDRCCVFAADAEGHLGLSLSLSKELRRRACRRELAWKR